MRKKEESWNRQKGQASRLSGRRNTNNRGLFDTYDKAIHKALTLWLAQTEAYLMQLIADKLEKEA